MPNPAPRKKDCPASSFSSFFLPIHPSVFLRTTRERRAPPPPPSTSSIPKGGSMPCSTPYTPRKINLNLFSGAGWRHHLLLFLLSSSIPTLLFSLHCPFMTLLLEFGSGKEEEEEEEGWSSAPHIPAATFVRGSWKEGRVPPSLPSLPKTKVFDAVAEFIIRFPPSLFPPSVRPHFPSLPSSPSLRDQQTTPSSLPPLFSTIHRTVLQSSALFS